MTRLRSTQVALVSSVVLLFLSCTMLLGTTYAWLIDGVSTSKNRVVVGNLDIDLLMLKDGNYVSVADGSGDIFAEANGGKAVKWEPGMQKTVYFAAKNIGALALKYDITLATNVADASLANGLEYAISVGGDSPRRLINNWETIEDESQNTGLLNKKLIKIVDDGELYPEEDKNTYYFAITVRMPEDALNSFQGESVTLDLSIAATQLPYEEDSFGKKYDIKTYSDESISENSEENYDAEIPDGMTVVTIDSISEFKDFVNAVNTDTLYDDVEVANNPDVFVKLTKDLNISSFADFDGIGDGEENSFDGIFNGYDHTIKNLITTERDTNPPLFRSTKGCDIVNLVIENFQLDSTSTETGVYAILLGTVEEGDVLIDNVTIKDSIISGKGTIGIVVGYIKKGNLTITNCTIQDILARTSGSSVDVAGTLLGDGYSGVDTDEISFKEEDNTIEGINW